MGKRWKKDKKGMISESRQPYFKFQETLPF
jgi:hypothetical protein